MRSTTTTYAEAMFNFSYNVYQLRMQRGWTQAELAVRTNIPQSHIVRHLKGQQPTLATLATYAKAFDITVAELVGPPIESSRPAMYNVYEREIGYA